MSGGEMLVYVCITLAIIVVFNILNERDKHE